MSATTPDKSVGFSPAQIAARDRIYAAPLDSLDPGDPAGFASGEMHWTFERLRKEDPVHFTPESVTEQGAYWSLTKWDDIVAADTDPRTFSAQAGITLHRARPTDESTALFDDSSASEQEVEEFGQQGVSSLLSMDPPEHEIHRNAVAKGVSPANLAALEPLIRQRAGAILDGLPIGEEFDWVDTVSKELTAMTLATLFDYPQEDRRKLTYWSDVATTIPMPGHLVESAEEWDRVMREFFQTISGLIERRAQAEPRIDFLSLLAHNPHAKRFTVAELFGDGLVLLVGGNDTTRNTISASVYALNKFPEQNAKLRENPALVPSMVSETIRWQTPLAHMMRKTTKDVEFGGKQLRKGDRVALWYVSGNRDEDKIERPDEYVIDRKNPRQHLSFGFGIHRCLGNRLAELQLKVIWEEILARFPEIKVVTEPTLSFNNFAKGYAEMRVVIPRRN
ncbi:cytochrome P450 [Streptomyces sp. NPDC051976]|uniref:cytochrome P450 n=1 Tax=Streptomyces sp. NPDC051976 TaxID=3154947 RepID=UPI00342F3BDC